MRRLSAWAGLVLIGCAPKAGPGPAGAESLSGFWLTDGYGRMIEIIADTAVQISEVTAISCLPAFRARAVPPPPGARAAFLRVDAPSTFVILPDSAPDQLRIHFNGAASDVIAKRIVGPLDVCRRPAPSTPTAVFEVFATTWKEHYPFFALKGMDWDRVVAEHRAKVSDSMAPAALFAQLTSLIEPLNDPHTSIRADSLDLRFGGNRPPATREEWDRAPRYFAITEKYLDAPIRKFCEGQVEFGTIGDVGFLRIRSFDGYHQDEPFESGLVALEAALDTIFAGASAWRGMIIDVRFNGGGADPYGLAIAARLTGSEYVAYAKQARNDRADPNRWTPEQISRVVPTDRPGFRGPVVELIGLYSVSAAETFTQALINRAPKVVRVGENTQGVFSDVMGRRLPNGWRFGLPNERFVTNGVSYDGPGIPPDVMVPVFPARDRTDGKDRSLERALTLVK